MKNYCDRNQFPALPFCDPHPKPRGARGLGKHYHLRFNPKLGHGICATHRITCACVAFTSMLDQPWIYVIPSKKQTCNQPVTYCTYWTVPGSYNNFNIIHLTPKSTPLEVFDEIHQVVLDGISDNMASLVQSGMYGVINTDDTKKNAFYVIQFISEAYTLQNNTQVDRQVMSSSELFVKAQYICSV